MPAAYLTKLQPWPLTLFDFRVNACQVADMHYIRLPSFAVDNSMRFPFRARTHRQTHGQALSVTYATDHPAHALVTPPAFNYIKVTLCLAHLVLGWLTKLVGMPPQWFIQVTQPLILSGTGNEYLPKGSDAQRQESGVRYGSLHLWINAWVAGKLWDPSYMCHT